MTSLDGKPVDWYNDLKSVGELENAVIFTNELLDALPFHRVVGDPGGLKELYVGIDPDDGGFVDIIGEPSTGALSDYFALWALSSQRVSRPKFRLRPWIGF